MKTVNKVLYVLIAVMLLIFFIVANDCQYMADKLDKIYASIPN